MRSNPDRTLLVGVVLCLLQVTTQADAPDFLADYGGGGTEPRTVAVEERMFGGYDFSIHSPNRVEGLDNLQVRYKLYTLLGELVVDTLFYWEFDSDAHLVYRFEYTESNLYRFDPLEGDVYREGVLSAAALAEYPDLLEMFYQLKPLNVGIRLWLDYEGGVSGFDQIDETHELWRERFSTSIHGRPYVIVTPDLFAGSGVWQNLSVPSSPSWESDHVGPGTRELFAARLPSEDVVARLAEPEQIVWPEGTIKYIASEYLRREALQDRAARKDQIRREEAELSDDDFWGSSDEVVEESLDYTVPVEPVAVLPVVSPQASTPDQGRYRVLSATTNPIDVRVERRQDGGRSLRIVMDDVLAGTEILLIDAAGDAVSLATYAGGEQVMQLQGTETRIEFLRTGELIASYSELANPDFVSAQLRLYAIRLWYHWSDWTEPRDGADLSSVGIRRLSFNGEPLAFGSPYEFFDIVPSANHQVVVVFTGIAGVGVDFLAETSPYPDDPYPTSLVVERFTPETGTVSLEHLTIPDSWSQTYISADGRVVVLVKNELSTHSAGLTELYQQPGVVERVRWGHHEGGMVMPDLDAINVRLDLTEDVIRVQRMPLHRYARYSEVETWEAYKR